MQGHCVDKVTCVQRQQHGSNERHEHATCKQWVWYELWSRMAGTHSAVSQQFHVVTETALTASVQANVSTCLTPTLLMLTVQYALHV